MLKLGARQLLVVLLCVLMTNPPSIGAASTPTTSRAVLGSIASNGSVRVGEILVPAQGTIFSGDRVNTNSGSAVIQYRDGARVTLASGSLANFAANRVQLEKGLMTFQTAKNGVVFAASTLRLEPTTAKASANVTLNDAKASVAVTEGSVKVVDPSGVELASLTAGDARLFEEAPSSALDPAAASPAASAAAPQGAGHTHRTWLIALGIGAIGTALAVAALSRASDADDRAEAATAANAALASQFAAGAAQLQAAQAQVAALTTRLNALGTAVAGVAALAAQLAAANRQLADAETALSRIVADLAAGRITAAQAATQITALQATIATINASINGITNRLIACASSASAANPSCT